MDIQGVSKPYHFIRPRSRYTKKRRRQETLQDNDCDRAVFDLEDSDQERLSRGRIKYYQTS